MRYSLIRLLIVLAGLIALGVVVMVSRGRPEYVLVAAWAIVALCAVISVIFHYNVIRPMRSIVNGLDLLREQDFSSRLVPVGQRETDRIVGMFNQMMATLKEERLRVREQNYFMDLLIDVSPMGILIIDVKGNITHANSAAAAYLGYAGSEALHGVRLPELDSRLGHVLAQLQPSETVTARLDDSLIFRCSRLSFMDKGYAHPFITIEALTEEVMMAERRSYEKVIRVIAHEVNNSMAGICSMLDTITMYADEDGRDESETEALKMCAQRCKSLSSFITTYADVVKIPEISPVKTDLNGFVAGIRVMLESLCVTYGVTVRFELCEDEIPVMLDHVLFEQVLINIVKNSAESASTRDGVVTITTQAAPAMLVVTDNGEGISEEVSARLFSPFFTTKPQGQGIGLLFVRDVLRQHRCRFSLRTDDDCMTRFRITFPTLSEFNR